MVKAIIRYDFPEIGVIFYNLPLFDCTLKKNGFSVVRRIITGNYDPNYKQWSLYIESSIYVDGDQIYVQYGQPTTKLTEYQIKRINELYFYMLDHPELKEGSIDL